MASYPGELTISTAKQLELPYGVFIQGSISVFWSLMKAWQNDGSDFVTAVELSQCFGQVSIENQLAHAFKEQVRASMKTIVLHDLISLVDGPTESLSAAFSKQSNDRTFAMVVQLSFLAYVHKADPVAAAIASHYKAEEQQDQQWQNPPCQDQQKVSAVIKCCQEQTVAWDWEPYLALAADKVGIVSKPLLIGAGDGLDGHYERGDPIPDLESAKAAIDGTIF